MARFIDIQYCEETIPTISELSSEAQTGESLQKKLKNYGVYAEKETADIYIERANSSATFTVLETAYSKEFKMRALANFLKNPFYKDNYLADFFLSLKEHHSKERTSLKMLSSRGYLEDFAIEKNYSLDLVRGLIRLARAELVFELNFWEKQSELNSHKFPINLPKKSVLEDNIIWEIAKPIGEYIIDIQRLSPSAKKSYMLELPIIGSNPVHLIRKTYSTLYGTYSEQKAGKSPMHKSVGALLPYDVEALKRYYEYKSICHKKSSFDFLAMNWYLHPSSAKHKKAILPLEAFAKYINKVTNIPLKGSHDLIVKPWIYLLSGLNVALKIEKES